MLVRYPYWTRRVRENGLAVDARLKVQNGIPKFHFRELMGNFLPLEVAWRKKIPLHVGSGTRTMFRKMLNVKSAEEEVLALRTMATDALGISAG